MYQSFFGFKEKPFKLVPNPDYLYMSKCHEIAMAHLVYATDQGDGFVVISGEVGTGKTTLCRTFLELLNDQTESAYIFNPKMDSVELLSAICTEFGIEHQRGTVKELIDALNHYLIRKNEMGHKAILIIDEAQNLTVENLEMVRMISNLETTRSKLLQIILMGQPELNDKLDSPELRQLAQRISLNYYLMPLSAKETEAYIRHRINIAAQRPLDVFQTRACRLIHRYSKGIPRLINIACDRALLTAYTLGKNRVTTTIIHSAINELNSRNFRSSYNPLTRALTWAVIILALVVILVTILKAFPIERLRRETQGVPGTSVETSPGGQTPSTLPPDGSTFKVPIPLSEQPISSLAGEKRPAGEAPSPMVSDRHPNPAGVSPENIAAKRPELPESAPESRRAIEALEPFRSRIASTETVLALWEQPNPKADHLPAVVNDTAFFDIAARQYGLRLYRVDNNWPLVKKINLPTIVAIKHADFGRPVYLTVTQWSGDTLTLMERPGKDPMIVDFSVMQGQLEGAAFVFWKNIFDFDATISKGANTKAVLSLKRMLHQLGYAHLAQDGVFDDTTMAAVMDFQARQRLDIDGLAGSLTKILMINQSKAVQTPQLDRPQGG